MKYLGIDYGEKRVGVSISDEFNRIAFPLKVINNSDKIIFDIIKICEENKIGEIVVGESKDYKGTDNEIMKEINLFVDELKKNLELPVSFHPEFMTSMEAERLQGKNEMLDASAAAIILKNYLDTINNKNSENI